MEVPIFLIADNSQYPDDIYIIHTEYPRFILNVETEEIDWWDDLKGDKEQMNSEITQLIEQAFNFLETEMNTYDEDDEDESDF